MFQKLRKINKVLIFQKSLFLENFLLLLALFSPFNEVLVQNVSCLFIFSYLATQ